MKIKGCIILTAYSNPRRWEIDDNHIYKNRAEAKHAYNQKGACHNCGAKPFGSHVKQGFITLAIFEIDVQPPEGE